MITLVSEGVYRGPRPTRHDQSVISVHGIQTIISLEGLEEDQDEVKEFPGIFVSSCPISFTQIYMTGISQDYFTAILDQINDAAKPLLIHCQHGEDRTGLIIAGYRVRECHWTKVQAEIERDKYGYREWLNFGLNRTWEGFQ